MAYLRAAIFGFLAAGVCAAGASADEAAFSPGPVIEDYGPVADIEGALAIPDDAEFRIAYDVREKGADGEPNRALVTAARFINMHARAGVDPERIHLAVVVHGKAVRDVTNAAAYRAAEDADNPNLDLIAALSAYGVKVYVCGQSAAYYGVATEDLAPGVDMALSAMTMHALLQQWGYTLNPF